MFYPLVFTQFRLLKPVPTFAGIAPAHDVLPDVDRDINRQRRENRDLQTKKTRQLALPGFNRPIQ